MNPGWQFILAATLLAMGFAATGGTPQPPAGSFTATGSMSTARYGHSATLLLDGRVLVAGGDGGRTAELYDPASGLFVATGSMVMSRQLHSATRLPDGRVLLVGGRQDASAELFDPATGSFSPTGEMRIAQHWHSAVTLANGKVLVVGDIEGTLYDPRTERFAPAGPYAKPSYFLNTTTLLADGRVLLVGDDPARLYDPATNTFSETGSLGAATLIYGLELNTATLLTNGNVLITGGMNDEVWPLGLVAAAELYEAATGKFRTTSPMRLPRDGHAAARLPDGRVLIVGGYSAACDDAFACGRRLADAEIYDPSSGTFAAAGNMTFPRQMPRATPLTNGDVLITGGSDASAELYHPSARPSYQGLWWSSPGGSESGWGVSIAHQGDILFATWSTYDADGNPTWLAMPRGELVDSAPTYAGTLYRTAGPPSGAGRFDPSDVVATAVGSATFRFTDVDNGAFTYQLEGVARTKPITRYVFSSLPTCALGGASGPSPNFQDLWWNSPAGSESGWGVSIEHQGDILFATWLTYDSIGRSLWLTAPRAIKTRDNVYSGALYRASGPAFSSPSWDATRVVATPVGDVTFAFADEGNGTFTAIVNGVAQAKAITRLAYSSPATICH